MRKTRPVRYSALRTVLGIALALLLFAPAALEPVFASSALQYGMTPVYGRDIEDGTYEIEVRTDSKYYKVGACKLTVKGDEMTAVITLDSTAYTYAYPGTGIEAKKDDAGRIEMTRDDANYTLTYEMDVPALNADVPCAAYSKRREKWYDRNLVFVAGSLPEEALKIALPDYDLIEESLEKNGGVPEMSSSAATADNEEADDDSSSGSTSGESSGESSGSTSGDSSAGSSSAANTGNPPAAVDIDLKDGEYAIEVALEGGSGRASVSTPTWLTVKDGKAYATLLWSSPHYDYMIVDGYRYDNETTDGGNSTFTIPITAMDAPMKVIADTTAMGDPVEIEYMLTFFSDTVGAKSSVPQEATKRIIVVAAVIIVLGGILNYFVKRGRR